MCNQPLCSFVIHSDFNELMNHLVHQSSAHQHICVFKVISPVRPDLPLAANVPNVQFKTLRLDTFNVEALEQTQNSKQVKDISPASPILFFTEQHGVSSSTLPPCTCR